MGRGHPTSRTPSYVTGLEVLLEAKNDKIAELQAQLVEIANIAHHGGLIGKGTNDIRRLTLPYWDKDECDRLQGTGEE